jgi:hypothetical protein
VLVIPGGQQIIDRADRAGLEPDRDQGHVIAEFGNRATGQQDRAVPVLQDRPAVAGGIG